MAVGVVGLTTRLPAATSRTTPFVLVSSAQATASPPASRLRQRMLRSLFSSTSSRTSSRIAHQQLAPSAMSASPQEAAATAAAATTEAAAAFSGRSAQELGAWLASSGVDTRQYGRGSAKSLDQLWEEVVAGETQLFIEGGRPRRRVAVLNVFLRNSRGQTLYEAEQVLPNGSRRCRGLPLSEKLLPGERWQEAAVRGVLEELGPALPAQPQVELDEGSARETVETKESQSYPGLLSTYVCTRVSARVVSGLPEGPFTTDEQRSDGLLQHCWEWR